MTKIKESTRSFFDLWRDSRHLLSAVAVYRERSKLLQREVQGLTTSVVDDLAVNPQIIQLEDALREAIPLLKELLDTDLFEETLLDQDDEKGTSDTPF